MRSIKTERFVCVFDKQVKHTYITHTLQLRYCTLMYCHVHSPRRVHGPLTPSLIITLVIKVRAVVKHTNPLTFPELSH